MLTLSGRFRRGHSPLSQSDKILAVTSAASVDLEPIWASLVAKALEGKNVKELLVEVGAGSTATLVVDGVPADAAGPDIEEPPLTQQQKEEEESDDDIVRPDATCLLF